MKKIIKYPLYLITFFLATYVFFELRWQCRIDFIQSDKVRNQIIKMDKMSWIEPFWYGEMVDEKFLDTLSQDERTEFQAAILYAFPTLLDGRNGDASLTFNETLVSNNAENLAKKLESLRYSKSYFCSAWRIPLINSWQKDFEKLAEFYKTPQGAEYLEWKRKRNE